jgi:hypothetical protein
LPIAKAIWLKCFIIIYLFLRGTSYGRGRRINFKGGSFDWKSRVLEHILSVKRDRKATNTLSPPTISPKTSNKDFEIAILFYIADFQIEIIFLRRILPPQPSGHGL